MRFLITYLLFMVLPYCALSQEWKAQLLQNYRDFEISSYDYEINSYQYDKPDLQSKQSGRMIQKLPLYLNRITYIKAEIKKGKSSYTNLYTESLNNGKYHISVDKRGNKISDRLLALDLDIQDKATVNYNRGSLRNFLTHGFLDLIGGMYKLPELLSKSVIQSVSNEQLENILSTKIVFTNDFGRYTLWLDPERNYTLLKLNIYKDKKCLFYDDPRMTLEQIVQDDEVIPETYLEEQTADYITTNITKIGNRYYATGYRSREITKANDGSVTSDQLTEGKISNININPTLSDKDFKFTIQVPNGTPVTVHQDRVFRYEWRDGEIVKIESNPELEAVVPVLAPPRRRWELLIGGGVAFVLLFSLFWWRYRRGPA